MEDKKKNEIIAQGNQAAPLITDMLANEVILEIELPAQEYIQNIIYSATREAIDITSYIKDYDVILKTDIRKIKAIKISDATDKMKYVILNLISASSIYLDRGEKTNVKFGIFYPEHASDSSIAVNPYILVEHAIVIDFEKHEDYYRISRIGNLTSNAFALEKIEEKP